VLSLPVAATMVGMPKLEYLDANIAVAKNFKPLPKAEMRKLAQCISATHKLALDRFFAHHVDA
jgi:aryl-alcohol dehydrogenase-like predicted oxidoreductase